MAGLFDCTGKVALVTGGPASIPTSSLILRAA